LDTAGGGVDQLDRDAVAGLPESVMRGLMLLEEPDRPDKFDDPLQQAGDQEEARRSWPKARRGHAFYQYRWAACFALIMRNV